MKEKISPLYFWIMERKYFFENGIENLSKKKKLVDDASRKEKYMEEESEKMLIQ